MRRVIHYSLPDPFLQLTTDGYAPYRSAVLNTLEYRVSFSQLIKVYRATPEGEHRHSPVEVVSTEVVPVRGNPDPERVCTSHVERSNSVPTHGASPVHQAHECLFQKLHTSLRGHAALVLLV